MTCRVHLLSRQREVLSDRAEAREKRLHATRITKTAHLAFGPAGRLVVLLGTVVHACGRLDENLLHTSELGNVGLRRLSLPRPVSSGLPSISIYTLQSMIVRIGKSLW